MLAELYPLARPVLFALDAERAHDFTLAALSRLGSTAGWLSGKSHPEASRTVMGINFPNPVGLAAGLDKNGAAIDAFAALGFGFLEVGTVTPLPQLGNPKPRMFRLRSANALINRMGFNNLGLGVFLGNVARAKSDIVLGLNIGKNASTSNDDAVLDYLLGLREVYPHASYVTVNISSPNTKGLRDLQSGDALDALLGALKSEQQLLQRRHQRYVPIALKIAPDLGEDEIIAIARRVLAHQFDGVIATNTTLSRAGVEGLQHAEQAGGLSGAPLARTATEVISLLRAELGGAIPIIGVGGILSGSDAVAKIRAGASLVQIYTGLIYRGPALISECIDAIAQDTASRPGNSAAARGRVV